MRVYAIGDIHGQRAMLAEAHARIARDRAEVGDTDAPVIHLGDMVDRGPDSRGVIDDLLAGQARGEPWIALKGNHDQIFASQIGLGDYPPSPFRSWISGGMGGDATCLSYGVTPSRLKAESASRRRLKEAVPEAHRTFLADLPLFYETPDLLFVHAGIRPGLALSEQIEHDLMWIRYDFLDDRRDHGRLVVHGHTPEDRPDHRGNRINLDTGAGFGRPLTTAVFEGTACFILDAAGRRPLLPG